MKKSIILLILLLNLIPALKKGKITIGVNVVMAQSSGEELSYDPALDMYGPAGVYHNDGSFTPYSVADGNTNPGTPETTGNGTSTTGDNTSTTGTDNTGSTDVGPGGTNGTTNGYTPNDNTTGSGTDETDPYEYEDYGNEEILPKDCAGVRGGTAYKDSCEKCVGGTTGKLPCVKPPCPDSTLSTNFSESDIGSLLKYINPDAPPATCDSIAKYLKQYGEDFGLNTPLRYVHFIAQISAETGNFTVMTENWHYSKAGIQGTFPKKVFPDSIVQNYVNCVCVFDRSYADKYGNGNEASKDGSTYSGHGLIQLTFKDTYVAFNNYMVNNFADNSNYVTHPTLLATNFKAVVLSSLWFFGKYKPNALKNADADKIIKVTEAVNGGRKGLDKREAKLKRAKSAFCL